ncbi:hypothetical protein [Actinophytocola sp.]|uniref:hypothetical protein n=1 Tax=Actinophytocola sp. TaxID=1872138 RepID=UPI002D7F54F2|nr:hypothetical protein [Actinophytocola sp.]HET9141163.1 hypothetical protein [Actinophytocola sp.]
MWFDHHTPHAAGDFAAPFGHPLTRSPTHKLVRALLITLAIGFVIVRYAVRRYARGELTASALGTPEPD